jgi:hypothetical protein
MYIGDTTRAEQRRMERAQIVRPSLRDTIAQRGFERDAERIERNAARDLERAQRRFPIPAPPSLPATPSDGSPVVTASGGEPMATGTDAGASAGGGSSTVNVTPADASAGGSIILPLVIGAAALLLF